ncbi:NPCBM/NEW2 domain-containing protein [Pendulispora rubella]|uniref:Alpha-galactosidase n=1 Tax=Pendulispora rubella TaxID=2741070 RepID=A0ABZ2KSP4_9BACT
MSRQWSSSKRRATGALLAASAAVLAVACSVDGGERPEDGSLPLQGEAKKPPQANTVQAINDLAKTPYQGWNTYFGLSSSFTEQTIKEAADAIVRRGLKDVGYEYVWIDGGWWNGDRDTAGNIAISPTQWPNGMKAVADYIHSLGLKAGIYTDVGINGCGGKNQGSYGHYQQDFDQFAAWGYDAVKVDFCGGKLMDLDPPVAFGQVRDAILNNSSHRPMLFNICNPFVPETGASPGRAAYDSYKFGPTTGNSWRTDTDIGFPRNVVFVDLLRNFDHNAAHPEAAGPGHWNDPDYLCPEIGMTPAEFQAQFSMWAVVAAPLIIGSDVRNISDASVEMLKNREVIAIDQDPLGVQGTAISTVGDAQVYTKPLSNGDYAVALFNRGPKAQVISTTARQVGLANARGYALRDVWKHASTETAGKIAANVGAHSAVLFRVSKAKGENPPSVVMSPLTITTPSQAVLPLVVPGSTFTVSTSFTNHARQTVREATLTLSVPTGWKASPVGNPRASRLRTGETVNGKWNITVPAGTVPGPNDVKTAAAYQWDSDDCDGESGTVTDTSVVQVPPTPPANTTALSHHPWLDGTSAYLVPRVDREVASGGPLVMLGTRYAEGIGTNGPSVIDFYVGGACTKLTGVVGIDDSVRFDPQGGTSVFQVFGDGVKLYDSGLVTRTATKPLSVDLGSAKVLSLVVTDGGDHSYNDRANWANLQIACAAPQPTVPAGPWPHYESLGGASATATSANDGNPASDAIDGNVNTIWHSRWSPAQDPLPISFTLDLKSPRTVSGLTYLPRVDGTINGTVTSYEVEVSSDGTTFAAAAPAGAWPQDALLKSVQIVPISARYIRLTAKAGAYGFASASEIGVATIP